METYLFCHSANTWRNLTSLLRSIISSLLELLDYITNSRVANFHQNKPVPNNLQILFLNSKNHTWSSTHDQSLSGHSKLQRPAHPLQLSACILGIQQQSLWPFAESFGHVTMIYNDFCQKPTFTTTEICHKIRSIMGVPQLVTLMVYDGNARFHYSHKKDYL